jgi:hypothetical protein
MAKHTEWAAFGRLTPFTLLGSRFSVRVRVQVRGSGFEVWES